MSYSSDLDDGQQRKLNFSFQKLVMLEPDEEDDTYLDFEQFFADAPYLDLTCDQPGCPPPLFQLPPPPRPPSLYQDGDGVGEGDECSVVSPFETCDNIVIIDTQVQLEETFQHLTIIAVCTAILVIALVFSIACIWRRRKMGLGGCRCGGPKPSNQLDLPIGDTLELKQNSAQQLQHAEVYDNPNYSHIIIGGKPFFILPSGELSDRVPVPVHGEQLTPRHQGTAQPPHHQHRQQQQQQQQQQQHVYEGGGSSTYRSGGSDYDTESSTYRPESDHQAGAQPPIYEEIDKCYSEDGTAANCQLAETRFIPPRHQQQLSPRNAGGGAVRNVHNQGNGAGVNYNNNNNNVASSKSTCPGPGGQATTASRKHQTLAVIRSDDSLPPQTVVLAGGGGGVVVPSAGPRLSPSQHQQLMRSSSPCGTTLPPASSLAHPLGPANGWSPRRIGGYMTSGSPLPPQSSSSLSSCSPGRQTNRTTPDSSSGGSSVYYYSDTLRKRGVGGGPTPPPIPGRDSVGLESDSGISSGNSAAGSHNSSSQSTTPRSGGGTAAEHRRRDDLTTRLGMHHQTPTARLTGGLNSVPSVPPLATAQQRAAGIKPNVGLTQQLQNDVPAPVDTQVVMRNSQLAWRSQADPRPAQL